jgi:hypothetical protein
MPQRMPALFFGHGNPMNCLLVNPYTEQRATLGAGISVVLREGYSRCSIPRPVIPMWRGVCRFAASER